MKSVRGRIIFDVLLTAVLLFEVLHQLTGNMLHEIVGVAFAVCILVHLVFAARWIKDTASSLRAGELGKRQRRLAVVAALLAVDFIVLMVSSVMISELLWNAGVDLTPLNPGHIWYPVHSVAAYVLCILVLGHLAMHWSTVASALRVPYDPSKREAISHALNGVVMIGGIALGVVGVARAGFQASDFSVNEAEKTTAVESGYRERNAQTGEYTSKNSFEITSLSDDAAAADGDQAETSTAEPICTICPRQCKLSSPRCNRPYEAGLIS
ncbi:MAG: cytochrome b/b6 domain-containing protein [Eggerthellaceae bacterium]|nr:cytochrome b/b6 domain-containing protein [Eggerthellaceae bacterium]